MQLIVAEKPSVARDLARVLGVRPGGATAFEGDDCVITWCVGHLVELDEPASYDPRWKSWRLDTLPMLPAEFRLRPSKHAGQQLRAVVKLLRDRRFTAVVNACDAGREGELIFRYVYQYAGGGPPVRRLWISSLTDDAIRRGFAALRPGGQFDALGDAARARSEADWLVGMNATRAVTARGRAAGGDALFSIGRVQTPTLAMLVHREQAITAFVPRDYWELRGDFTTEDGGTLTAGWRHGTVARLDSAAIADEIVARDRAHGAIDHASGPRVERVRARTVREPAPLLFDLTSLQRTANRRFGFSAARTLEIAQALYERHKLLTYPRTDSRHLTTDVVPELPALFASLGEIPDYAPFVAPLLNGVRPGRRIVDDSKVHDHHAIIPTGKRANLDALDRDARRIFDLVARRFLGAFHPDAEFAVTEAWLRVGPGTGAPLPAPAERAAKIEGEAPVLTSAPPMPDRYLARGRVRVQAGWQAVAGIDGGDDRDRDEASATLPPLVEGQRLAGRFTPAAKQTTPPPRFTEATLLGAMESAGKAIDDEALRQAMKDCGLGTPATRAAVIETLLKRDYITRERQSLRPTATGIGLIEALPVAALASPELTGSWEARLARVARGEETHDAFMADIARFVAETVDAIRGAAPPAASAIASSAPIARCPRCGGAVMASSRAYACDADGCGFAIRTRIAGRAISADLAAVLIGRKRTQVLRGFRSKAGKQFAAMLVLDGDGEVKFEFEARRGSETAEAPPGEASETADAPRARTSRGPRARKGAARSTVSRSAAAPAKVASRAKPAIANPAIAKPAAIGELTCPRCQTGALITGARGWGCARWREGCRFVVWFDTAGRRLTAAQLRDLVTRGKTRKATFVANGAEVAGRLVLDVAADGGARLEPA